jgi:hypothetical protein
VSVLDSDLFERPKQISPSFKNYIVSILQLKIEDGNAKKPDPYEGPGLS